MSSLRLSFLVINNTVALSLSAVGVYSDTFVTRTKYAFLLSNISVGWSSCSITRESKLRQPVLVLLIKHYLLVEALKPCGVDSKLDCDIYCSFEAFMPLWSGELGISLWNMSSFLPQTTHDKIRCEVLEISFGTFLFFVYQIASLCSVNAAWSCVGSFCRTVPKLQESLIS